MLYLKETIIDEIEISKSRFITIISPIGNQDEIGGIISNLKKEYPKANHYCSAYIIGDDGLIQGSSDDGEPSGTAGLPMLEILRKFQLTNVLAVVIRYFGGIKLGAGGLIRAYALGVKECLNDYAKYYKKINAPLFEVQFNYNLINQIEIELSPYATYLNKEYSEFVNYQLVFPNSEVFILDKIKHLLISIKNLGFHELKIDYKADHI